MVFLRIENLLIMNWITIFWSVLLCCLIYVFIRDLNRNLPPGPWGLPIFGYVPFIGSQPGQTFFELGKVYGDVVRVKALTKSVICLNSYEAVKECYSTKGDEFSGRRETKDDGLWYMTNGTGFIREEGTTWREHRRFALQTLRDFGFGKLSLETRVQEIGQDLLDFLQNTNGQPTDPMDLLTNAAFNVILYLTTDKHFKPDDEDFVKIRDSIRAVLRSLTGVFIIFIQRITKFLPNQLRPGFPEIINVKEVFDEFLAKVLKEHEDTLDENNPRDYVDAFLVERNKALKEGKTYETTFTAPAKLRGYDIPARSVIIANLWGIHNDPKFWKDPERFDPERFMDPKTKAKRREHVIPFAIGKRSCLGESLARMELFIFMTMLLQKFKFVLQDGDAGDLTLQKTIIRALQPYKIKAIPRS